MKIDLTQTIKNVDGTELEPAAPLRAVLTNALLNANIPGDTASPDEKNKRFMLALSLNGQPGNEPANVDLPIEEVAKMKDLVGKAFPALIVGRVWQMLEAAGA